MDIKVYRVTTKEQSIIFYTVNLRYLFLSIFNCIGCDTPYKLTFLKRLKINYRNTAN